MKYATRLAMLMLVAIKANAHEAGAPFSGAIVDPLALHHAHIEAEQRINFFATRVPATSSNSGGRSYESELEVGWSNAVFNFGVEAFVPVVSVPSPNGQGREVGIGDMEVRPIKWAFINRPDLVVSTATGVGLPTGNRSRGLGDGNTTLTQYLFLDRALGNWYLGVNLAAEARIRGESGGKLNYGAVVAYSFIGGTPLGGLAAPVPTQSLVVSPSVEFQGSDRLGRGTAGDKNQTSVLPGLTLWWPRSGWQVHAGISIPLSNFSSVHYVVLLQLGNHFSW